MHRPINHWGHSMNLSAATDAPPVHQYCGFCGYDLHGITSPLCPECGQPASRSIIPWANREYVGLFSGFIKTVWIATVRPARLAEMSTGDRAYASAERFRWLVAALLAGPPMLVLLWEIHAAGNARFLGVVGGTNSGNAVLALEAQLLWSAGATLTPVVPIGIVIAALIGTAGVGYWFGGRNQSVQQRNRAIALGRYATAPLAWTLLIALVGVNCWVYTGGPTQPVGRIDDTPLWVLYVSWTLAFAMIVCAWRTTLVLLKYATHCGLGRLWITAIGLPLTWALAIGIGVGLLPMAVGLVRIMAEGLR